MLTIDIMNDMINFTIIVIIIILQKKFDATMKFILACALTNLFKIVINYLFISFLDSKINFFITLSYVYSLIEIIYFKPYPQFYFIKPIF